LDGILKSAIEVFNWCLSYIKEFLTMSPEYMFDGKVWAVVKVLHTAILPVSYAMIVCWFLWGIISSVSSLKEFKSLEHVFGLLLRLALTKWLVESSLTIILFVSDVVLQIIKALQTTMYGDPTIVLGLPDDALAQSLQINVFSDIGAWVLILILSIIFLLVSIGTGLSLLMITIGRFYKLFLYAAVSPIPLSSFASGDPQIGGISKQFLKSFMGVCMQAAVIYLALIIYPAFFSPMQANLFPVSNLLISYICKALFAQVLLLVVVKGSDQIVKEFGFG